MKKTLLFVTLLALASTTFASSYSYKSFAPENDLWKEDALLKTTNVTEEMFNKIIDAAYTVFGPMAKQNRESLKINRKWSDSTVNANVSRMFKYVTINMYGGLARRPEISPEGFALVLCHELGHAYGGLPYISTWQKLSAEGQADYSGAKDCLRKIIQTASIRTEFEPTAYIQDTCKDEQLCMRAFTGAQSTADLLATLMGETMPDFQTPDKTVVNETLKSYPATVQCRLDTYRTGLLNSRRPACWFKD